MICEHGTEGCIGKGDKHHCHVDDASKPGAHPCGCPVNSHPGRVLPWRPASAEAEKRCILGWPIGRGGAYSEVISDSDLESLEYHGHSSGTSTPGMVRDAIVKVCRELRERRAADAEELAAEALLRVGTEDERSLRLVESTRKILEALDALPPEDRFLAALSIAKAAIRSHLSDIASIVSEITGSEAAVVLLVGHGGIELDNGAREDASEGAKSIVKVASQALGAAMDSNFPKGLPS